MDVLYSLPGPVPTVPATAQADRFTKRLILLYVLLLVFEGALRKWVLPGLATPLLVVRDPVAILIIFSHLRRGHSILNLYTLPMLFIGLVGFLLTIGLGHGNLAVATYGLRTLALHFFLIFIIGEVMTRYDVERLGILLLYLLPPVTLLVGLQFFSPQSAWVNRGIGGDLEGAGFGGAMGFFRPSGPFSFTKGLTAFYGLAVAFVFYFWGSPRRPRKWLLLVATACVIIAIPLSISRGYLFQFVLTLVFFTFASLRSGRSVRMLLLVVLASPVLLLVLSQFAFFQTGIDVLNARFTSAARVEGGLEGTLGNRFLGGLFAAVTDFESTPWHGYGLGLGTNVGSSLLTGGRGFLLAEGEWGRTVSELGPWLGLPVILIRCGLGLRLLLTSVPRLLGGNSLPFLLLSFGILQITIAGWAQPTSLGFSILTAGLIVAALNDTSPEEAYPSGARYPLTHEYYPA